MININKLKKVNNICVFIRHGEKDVNNYCLTNKGKNKIIEFGNSLFLLNKKIIIYSSPEKRCIETANIISSIVNGPNSLVHISNILGKPGIQVKNEIEYTKLTDTMRCRDIFNGWKKGLYSEAMYSCKTIKARIINFFEKTSLKNDITLYIGQSGTIACTGYSLSIVDYYKTPNDKWVDFLDGYVLELPYFQG